MKLLFRETIWSVKFETPFPASWLLKSPEPFEVMA